MKYFVLSLIWLSAAIVDEQHAAVVANVRDQQIRRHKHKHRHRHRHSGPNSPQDTRGLEKGVSDAEFYSPPDGDYVTDLSPPSVSMGHLDYPYPAHKSSDDADRDFIEDSDSDNGAWNAQMKFDVFNSKLRKEKDDVVRVAATLEAAQVKLDEATEKEDVREEARKKVEEEWRAKQDGKQKLETRVKTKQDRVSIAEADVEIRTQDLQQSESELQEGTSRLQGSEKELHNAEQGVLGLDESRRGATEAKAMYDVARVAEVDAEHEVEHAREIHDRLARQLEKEKSDVKRIQAEVAYARLQLGGHARGSIDKEGDVGGIFKSNANSAGMLLALWLVLA